MSKNKLTSNKKKGSSSCFMQVACIVIFCIGVILGCQLLYLTWLRMDSKNWVETNAVVESSGLEKRPGRRSTKYAPKIAYKYVWTEQEYIGSRYDFSHNYEGQLSDMQEIADRYPVGETIICYVNPDNPKSAVIIRGAEQSPWGGAMLVVFVILITGLGLLANSLRIMAPKQRQEKLKQDRSGYYSLGTSGNAGEFYSCLVVTVIVIIVAGLAVYFLLLSDGSWINKTAGGFGAAGGVLTIVLFIKYLSGFKKSFCEILVNKPVVHLGEDITLYWKMPAAVTEKKLIILLSGIEDITRGSGSSATVITELFHSQLILMLEPPMSEEGEVKFTMPREGMPSTILAEGRYHWEVGIFAWSNDKDYVGSNFALPVAPAHLKGRGDHEV